LIAKQQRFDVSRQAMITTDSNKPNAKEAVEKVIDYAFNTIKVKKMEAFLHRSPRHWRQGRAT